jgi:glyoxylase-like metal-dependent hydrolase (beta-lactamase superfamily II)
LSEWLCATCAVEYPPGDAPPARCPICEDERQYVPDSGQAWTTLDELSASGTRLEVTEVEPGLFGIAATPRVGIGQQAMLLTSAEGSLLWDPTGFIDAAGADSLRRHGPLRYIVASHPHMYGAQTTWARLLGDAGTRILVAQADREWVQRADGPIETWSGDRELLPGVTLVTVGGHFPGSAVVHWRGADGRGVLLAGDTVFPGPSRRWVTFMRSYPNSIPMSAAVVERIAARLGRLDYERMYGNFGNAIPAGAGEVVQRSAERYAAWVRGDHDALT